jgi:GNAT superfamily N-acetyltransferase
MNAGLAPPPDPSRYEADGILRDGGSIRIRAIRPDDKRRLADHFGRLSPISIHHRFFRAKKGLTTAELAQFTELDFVDAVGLVATLGQGAEERILGVGRYVVCEQGRAGPRRAEVAFAVDDAHQGRGIGTLLLTHLLAIARAQGIAEFEADVLGDNNRMLEVFSRMGFVVRRSVESGVVHLAFPTAETEQSREAALARERTAAASRSRSASQRLLPDRRRKGRGSAA